MLQTRRTYYFNSPRPSHLLALRLRKDEKYSNITSISSASGLLTGPKDINTEFRNFFSNLYSSEITLDTVKSRDFLEKLNLPSLSQEEADHMGTPITLSELKEAVFSMKRGKSPGWDGIPPEFYSSFWDVLAIHVRYVSSRN